MQKNRSIKPKIRWKAKKSPGVWQGQHQTLEVQQALISLTQEITNPCWDVCSTLLGAAFLFAFGTGFSIKHADKSENQHTGIQDRIFASHRVLVKGLAISPYFVYNKRQIHTIIPNIHPGAGAHLACFRCGRGRAENRESCENRERCRRCKRGGRTQGES